MGPVIGIWASALLMGFGLGYNLGRGNGFVEGRDAWKKSHPGSGL